MLPVERKQSAIVLQQYYALASALQCCLARLGVVAGDGQIRLVAVEPSELDGSAQDATDFVVQRRHRYFALLNCGQQVGTVHECARRHFEIEAAVCAAIAS